MGKKRNSGISFHNLGAVSNVKMSFPQSGKSETKRSSKPTQPSTNFLEGHESAQVNISNVLMFLSLSCLSSSFIPLLSLKLYVYLLRFIAD